MLNIYDYISNSSMFKTFKVSDLLFVEYKCLIKETEIGYWSHHNYFMFVVGGKKKWKTREREFLLGDGEALFIKRGAYSAHQFFDDDFCALGVFIPDEFIKSVVSKFLSGNTGKQIEVKEESPIIPLHMDESLTAYFYSLLSYFSKQGAPPEKLLTIKFEELIINILTSNANSAVACYFMEVHGSSKISIRDIMENYFSYNMSLEEYAKLCGRSLSAFKKDFFEVYNDTPGKWLIKKRLDYGRFLLETTDKSVTQVAYESGFKNHSHFSRIFKELYKISPLKIKVS